MNKKGQALIEFVIILPILIFLILSIIDIGIILYRQNTLEKQLDLVVDLFQNNKENEIPNILEKNINYESSNNNQYQEITLSQEIELITPGLNLILGSPHEVNAKRVIYHE